MSIIRSMSALAVSLSIAVAASVAYGVPPLSVWENSSDHSKIFVKSDKVATGTPLKVKILHASEYTCGLSIDLEDQKNTTHTDHLATFDCMENKAVIGQELSVTAPTGGRFAITAGNYGEQISGFKPSQGGYEVTWKGDKASIITVLFY